MLNKRQNRMSLLSRSIGHPRVHEFQEINKILDGKPIISEIMTPNLTNNAQKLKCESRGVSVKQML